MGGDFLLLCDVMDEGLELGVEWGLESAAAAGILAGESEGWPRARRGVQD